MVSKIDRLTELFIQRAGLVEAELLPFLEIGELVIVSSLSRTQRALFDPKSSHHINFIKIFSEKLELESSDSSLARVQDS